MVSKIQADVLKNVNSAVDNLTLGTSGQVTVGGSLNIGGNYNITGTLTLGTALSVGNGGTGLQSLTAGRIPYGAGTSELGNSANFTYDGTNFTVGGTAARILGDFSNATLANRLYFQSNVTDGVTSLSAIPNGTSTQSEMRFYNGTDPNNASFARLTVGGASNTLTILQSSFNGTGSTLPLAFYVGGSESMRIDSSGKLGLGVTPSAWGSGYKVFEVGSIGGISTSTNVFGLYTNAYVNSSFNYIYRNTNYATMYLQNANGTGQHQWHIAPSGSANGTIFFTQAMTLDQYGSLLVGTITSPTTTANLGTISTPGTVVMGSSFKRNFLINGDMRIAQRATSYTLTTSIVFGLVDRFAFFSGTASSGVVSQVAASLDTFQNAVKFQRNSGSTATGAIGCIQAIETTNSLPMQGLPVTLSFYAKRGANFSGSGNAIRVFVGTGTGTDQSTTSFGAWTNQAFPINTTQAITTTWTRYTFTATLSSSATQVGIQIDYVPTGTAGADDSVYITGLQLEVGSVATPYERQIYSDQLAQCQRYYEKSDNLVSYVGTRSIVGISPVYAQGFSFIVPKRAAPTVVLYDRSGTANKISIIASGASAGTSVTAINMGSGSIQAIADSGGGLAAGVGYEVNYIASAEL
jgi:hypothetical protein